LNDLVAGYRFADLKARRIVSSRSDLHRKQRSLGFPMPIKTGERAAWWPASEVHAWLRSRAALRDKPKAKAREAESAALKELTPDERETSGAVLKSDPGGIGDQPSPRHCTRIAARTQKRGKPGNVQTILARRDRDPPSR
jgi:predicted DNA-binding transcriptional regulator AlpA